MLVLTCQIGDDRLALDVRRVREVVPRVRLQRVAGSPAWLAGVFIYRGSVVPVIDLHRLIGTEECPLRLSSRIILVPHRVEGEERLLGLLAAQVADIRELRPRSQPQPRLTRTRTASTRPPASPPTPSASGRSTGASSPNLPSAKGTRCRSRRAWTGVRTSGVCAL